MVYERPVYHQVGPVESKAGWVLGAASGQGRGDDSQDAVRFSMASLIFLLILGRYMLIFEHGKYQPASRA